MLIALIDGDRRARALHKGFVQAGGHAPVVPGPALSQAWRTSSKSAYAWKRLLEEVVVFPGPRAASQPGRTGAGPAPSCLPCAAGATTEHWKVIGDMLGRAVLPPKRQEKAKPDPVDALAVLVSLLHGGGRVLTSDPEDIAAYAATLPGCGVEALSV